MTGLEASAYLLLGILIGYVLGREIDRRKP